MTPFASRLFAGALLGALALACGSDDDSAGSGPPTDATMSAIADVYCQKASECSSDLLLRVAYGSIDTCKARFKAQLQLDVKASGYGVSDAQATACQLALKTITCADVFGDNPPATCRFTGGLTDGSNCTSDAQCQSGSCFIDKTAACGKCGPRAAKGADCTSSQCAYGLRCNATKICTDGGLGATCSQDSDCNPLTYCKGGVCTAPIGSEGTACVVKPGANDPVCDPTKALFCLPKTLGDVNGTCTKVTVSSAATGEKCGFKSLTPPEVILCTNGECISDKCVARLADGATCTGADGDPQCQEPAECRGGVCSLKDPTSCK